MSCLFRLKEEEERKNKQAALAAVKAAKAAMSTILSSPEENKLKAVPSIPKSLLSPDKAAVSSDISKGKLV